MQLSLKQKALLQTLTLIGSALAFSAVVSLMFTYLSVPTIFITFGLAMLAYFGHIVYEINLNQLKYKETLNEMLDK